MPIRRCIQAEPNERSAQRLAITTSIRGVMIQPSAWPVFAGIVWPEFRTW
jgi:hypothetical protein